MKKCHREMVMCPFLKMSFLVAIICICSNEGSFPAEDAAGYQDTYDFKNIDRLRLNERITKLEAENRQQKQEMSKMKTKIDENRKEMENLNGRVSILEQSETIESQKTDDINVFSRPKRPYRLMPAKFPSSESEKGKDKGHTDGDKEIFYGPPTSCDDLQKLGYTLNGYYLTKGKDESNASRIQVVYCQFQQATWTVPSFQTWIGNVEVKTKSVHFYVQRNTKFHSPGILTFNIEQLNVGGAMNLPTGEFTAPVSGIYHFEFRCLKDAVPFESRYFLRVRQKERLTTVQSLKSSGNHFVVAAAYMANLSHHLPGSLTATLKLKASDVVNLYSNVMVYLHDGGAHNTQFAGWLVEEDLVLP